MLLMPFEVIYLYVCVITLPNVSVEDNYDIQKCFRSYGVAMELSTAFIYAMDKVIIKRI